MAIRMIVTDMDGTLLDAKNGISEKNRAALKEAADFLAENGAADGVARAVHAYVLEGK